MFQGAREDAMDAAATYLRPQSTDIRRNEDWC